LVLATVGSSLCPEGRSFRIPRFDFLGRHVIPVVTENGVEFIGAQSWQGKYIVSRIEVIEPARIDIPSPYAPRPW